MCVAAGYGSASVSILGLNFNNKKRTGAEQTQCQHQMRSDQTKTGRGGRGPFVQLAHATWLATWQLCQCHSDSPAPEPLALFAMSNIVIYPKSTDERPGNCTCNCHCHIHCHCNWPESRALHIAIMFCLGNEIRPFPHPQPSTSSLGGACGAQLKLFPANVVVISFF